MVSDNDRAILRRHAKRLGEANGGVPSKVSLNYAGAVIFHDALKRLPTT